MKSRLTIRVIVGVSLLLLVAASALYVQLVSARTQATAVAPATPATSAAPAAAATTPADDGDDPADATTPADLAPLAIVDFMSLEPSGVYDQPWAARQAVDIDTTAPIVVVFNRPLTRAERRAVRPSLSCSLHDVALRPAEWRGPGELTLRPTEPLAAGQWYRLDVSASAGESPLGTFRFRAREANAICVVAADFDGDGRIDLVAGGPGHPLRFYPHSNNGGGSGGSELPTAPGVPCNVPGIVRALATCNIDATPRPELAVVLEQPDGRLQLRVLARETGVNGSSTGWIDATPALMLDRPVETSTPTHAAGAAGIGTSVRRAPVALLSGDFTANGRQDLLLVDPFGRHQLIYSSRSGALLLLPIAAVSDWQTDAPVTAAVVADLDGDSIDDIALAVLGDGVHLLRNDAMQAGRRFHHEWIVPDTATVVSLCAADLDQDRWVDLFIGRAGAADDICLAQGNSEGLQGFRRATPSGLDGDALWTRGAAVVDLNADHQPDLIAARSEFAGITINLNDRAAGFNLPMQIGPDGGVMPPGMRIVPSELAGARARDAARDDLVCRMVGADFDGDGSKDLLAITESGRAFYLLTRRNVFRPGPEVVGQVTFEEGTDQLPQPAGPVACAVTGDINRDGWLDLAVGLVAGGAEIWLGSDGGKFSRDDFIADLRGHYLILTDVDHDGDLDLLDIDVDPAGASRDAGQAVILIAWNGGLRAAPDSDVNDAGRFGKPVPFVSNPVHERPTAVAVADFNGDGEIDVFLGGASGSLLLIGQGHDVFVDMPLPERLRAPADEASGPPPVTNAIAGDFDNDGLIDVMLGTGARADGETAPPVWLRNIGDGQFEAVPLPRSGGRTVGLSAGDLDANAALDLLWLDPDTRRLEIRLGADRHDDASADANGRWQRRAIPLDALFDTVTGLSLLDIDGDGTPEPVITGRQTGEGWQEVWRSDGYGTLLYAGAEGVSLRALSAGSELRPLLVADLTGNSRPDMLTVDEYGRLHLYLTRQH
ncbi:MAG: FG-GAP repeat domain-containing protein [Planctomycetota bacterium]